MSRDNERLPRSEYPKCPKCGGPVAGAMMTSESVDLGFGNAPRMIYYHPNALSLYCVSASCNWGHGFASFTTPVPADSRGEAPRPPADGMEERAQHWLDHHTFVVRESVEASVASLAAWGREIAREAREEIVNMIETRRAVALAIDTDHGRACALEDRWILRLIEGHTLTAESLRPEPSPPRPPAPNPVCIHGGLVPLEDYEKVRREALQLREDIREMAHGKHSGRGFANDRLAETAWLVDAAVGPTEPGRTP